MLDPVLRGVLRPFKNALFYFFNFFHASCAASLFGAIEVALLARAPNRLIARDPVQAAVIIRPLRDPPPAAEAFSTWRGKSL